jgi:hypothetical protein
MGLNDADGARRIDRARDLVGGETAPGAVTAIPYRVLRFGDRLATTDVAGLSATDRHTSLGEALRAVRDRYRGRALAGIVLVTDGGDNGGIDAAAIAAAGAPVYAIGIGPRSASHDREVVSVTAAESVLSDAMVDVAATGRRAWLRRRADRAAAAGEWPADRSAARQAGGRRVADQRDVPRLAESRRAHGLHRRDPLRGRRARR